MKKLAGLLFLATAAHSQVYDFSVPLVFTNFPSTPALFSGTFDYANGAITQVSASYVGGGEPMNVGTVNGDGVNLALSDASNQNPQSSLDRWNITLNLASPLGGKRDRITSALLISGDLQNTYGCSGAACGSLTGPAEGNGARGAGTRPEHAGGGADASCGWRSRAQDVETHSVENCRPSGG